MTAVAGRGLRVVFVNRYYSPDLSATSQMLTDLAEALAHCGLEVSVICSRQLYQDARAGLPSQEVIRGVRVQRMATARFGRDNLFGRAMDYATFYIAAAAVLLRRLRKHDVLVVKTDPPLLSLVGSLAAACKGARLVNWLQDVFPEVASRLAISPLPRPLEALLRAARDRSLGMARTNVVLGTRMRDYLISRGVAPQRIQVSENWADETAVFPLQPQQSALRSRLGLLDHFVVAYSGNLGRAHDFETLLRAAELLSEDRDLVFLMIGGGANMRELEAHVRARSLENIRFVPYQPRESLADALAAGDVHLVSLLPQLEGLIVPSKVYGILAAGRPVVFIGAADGEVARVVAESGTGVTVASGDGPGLRDALRRLRDDRAGRERIGARARSLFEERYTLGAAVTRWRQLLAASAAADGPA
jgi:colanic acid biosynthesis glycosyl transferase WcaI